MYPKYSTPQEIKKHIRSAILPLLPLRKYRLFFFGSRVSGTNGERSDIDLGIIGRAPIPAESMTAVREAIEELPILYPIDVVDMSTVSDEFKRNAMRHVEYLN